MKTKRFLSLMLFTVMLLGLMSPNIVFAENSTASESRVELTSIEDISEEEMELRENQRININLIEENVIQPRGSNPPSKVWDLKKDGPYNFSGSAETSPLYTEYILKSGGGGFGITVNNYHSKDLYIRVSNRSSFGQEIETLHVPGGKRASFNVYTDKNIDLRFSIPCDTAGRVTSLN